ncbi:hypothetical protein C8Q80DRAFT_1149364 [Daedaleopsis nitida]|nr:hypothetical protein C8Q80DRAFT_1149364 [Daedaleopsis nitida]
MALPSRTVPWSSGVDGFTAPLRLVHPAASAVSSRCLLRTACGRSIQTSRLAMRHAPRPSLRQSLALCPCCPRVLYLIVLASLDAECEPCSPRTYMSGGLATHLSSKPPSPDASRYVPPSTRPSSPPLTDCSCALSSWGDAFVFLRSVSVHVMHRLQTLLKLLLLPPLWAYGSVDKLNLHRLGSMALYYVSGSLALGAPDAGFAARCGYAALSAIQTVRRRSTGHTDADAE